MRVTFQLPELLVSSGTILLALPHRSIAFGICLIIAGVGAGLLRWALDLAKDEKVERTRQDR